MLYVGWMSVNFNDCQLTLAVDARLIARPRLRGLPPPLKSDENFHENWRKPPPAAAPLCRYLRGTTRQRRALAHYVEISRRAGILIHLMRWSG